MRRGDRRRTSPWLAGLVLTAASGLGPATAEAQQHGAHQEHGAHEEQARHEHAGAAAGHGQEARGHGEHVMAHGPQADVDAVLEVVRRLFDGMRANDGAMVRSTFAEGAQLIATEDQQGDPAVRYVPVERFAQAVEGATGEWDEPIWDTMVHVQDHLAIVWTKYAFYLDGEFSHCGVDAFLLARTGDGWKITSLSDTRQREGCETPPGRSSP